MKLTVILLTAAFLQVTAAGLSQTITLTVKGASLTKVFQEIKKQTGYVVFSNREVLAHAKPVTLAVHEMPLVSFLALVVKDQSLTYELTGETVSVTRTSPRPSPVPVSEDIQNAFIPITGMVHDLEGKPVAGASVLVKGRTVGTVTDANGKFSLNAEPGATLVITSIGYDRLELKVGKGQEYKISLRLSTLQIDSFTLSAVNTGYQRIRREQSTGAVSKITTKEYESRVSTDFLSGLVNKLPGLMINNDVQFSSKINGSTTSNSLFNVRGISTISGNQDPLIVIDGYPTELTLSMINPNEIESVTVLKDAAAATVYGVRASNGVIVIERKKAVAGKPRFNFRTTVGITPKENYSRYRWASDASAISIAYNQDRFKTSVNESTWLKLRSNASDTIPFPVYYIMAQQAANIISPSQAEMKYKEMSDYNNAEDYGRLFLRTAATQTYNLDISGGNPGALYYITANYTRNDLQQINNNNGKIMLSGRTTLALAKRLSLELITDYLEERSRISPVPALASLLPYERLQDGEGRPLPVIAGSRINPYYNSVNMSKGFLDHLAYPLIDANEISDKTRNNNNRITANFRYKLNGGFNLAFGGIYESARYDLRHYATEKSSEAHQYTNSYSQVNSSGGLLYTIPPGGFMQQQTGSSNSYTLRGQLNYDKQLNKEHSVNGIIGAEVRDVTDQFSSAAYFGYDDETLLQQPINYAVIATGLANPMFPTPSLNYPSLFNQQYSDNRYVSGFSNIVYSYRNTYSLTASARIDQSNLFGTNPKYKYKPLWSVGAAWNIHKEEFMQGLPWVKQLKLRIAEGINGNVAKLSLPRVIAKAVSNTYTVPVSPALTRYAFANNTLRWEQTNNFNVGLDFSLFRSITGSLDYYNKKSTDLLSTAQINPSIGNSAIINTASINNRGLELSLHADWVTTSRLNWNTGLVVARNTSKVLKVYQNLAYYPVSLNDAGYLEGRPLGALFAFRSAGLDNKGLPQVQDNKGAVYSASSPNIFSVISNPASGITEYMGSSVPSVNAGLSNRVDIGNFYFYCMINYYGGFKVIAPRPDPNDTRPLSGSGEYWKKPGDELHTNVMSSAGFASLYSGYFYRYSDSYVVNGDYLTLGDLTASYNFGNSPVFKKAGFSQFELKLQASNVYTIGLNKFNYSKATGSYAKSYITPTYTIALFTNF